LTLLELLSCLKENDPFSYLGVQVDMTDEEVYEEYQKKKIVFQKSNDDISQKKLEECFKLLETRQKREIVQLLSPSPIKNINHLKDQIRPKLRYLGPGPWIRALKKLN
jgi:hypothetical protein